MEHVVEYLPHSATIHQVRKNSLLLYPGEVPNQAYIVRSGSFRAYRIDNAGVEQIAGFKLTGDIFPECWVFGKTTRTMYYYEALEDSEVVTIEREVLLDLLEKRPEMWKLLFDRMVEHYTVLMLQVTALEQTHAVDKLLMTLNYLLFRFGEERSKGRYVLKLNVTHSLLAGMTGLSRETVSKELGRLRRRRVVRYGLREFSINKKALENRLDDESFSDIKLQ
ncbi:Crp/Fnr family transcriptional regulator [Candidatus Saccharibacteria bacterium]|nr:Crp/Fnr family transcriptional regulator [Candidatus Saccharibacteria bacterium]NCU40417.1 Crp/Fnr family transcriptional regulator [Candidatus Saccharibacteria bacterium]